MCAECKWQDVADSAHEMLSSSDYEYAKDALETILKWIEEHEHATPDDKRAIASIEAAGRRAGGW